MDVIAQSVEKTRRLEYRNGNVENENVKTSIRIKIKKNSKIKKTQIIN